MEERTNNQEIKPQNHDLETSGDINTFGDPLGQLFEDLIKRFKAFVNMLYPLLGDNWDLDIQDIKDLATIGESLAHGMRSDLAEVIHQIERDVGRIIIERASYHQSVRP